MVCPHLLFSFSYAVSSPPSIASVRTKIPKLIQEVNLKSVKREDFCHLLQLWDSLKLLESFQRIQFVVDLGSS